MKAKPPLNLANPAGFGDPALQPDKYLAPPADLDNARRMELPMKTVGAPFASDTQWARFGRLQRTAAKIIGCLPYERGVKRFRTLEDSDTWQTEQRLNRRGRPKTAT